MDLGRDKRHRWLLVTQILYRRPDKLPADEQIAKRPAAKRNDPPIVESEVAPDKPPPKKPLPPRPGYYAKTLVAQRVGPTEDKSRGQTYVAPTLDFDVFG